MAVIVLPLLAVALVLLALGLVTSAAGWLVASLGVSVVAGLLLLRVVLRGGAHDRSGHSEQSTAEQAGSRRTRHRALRGAGADVATTALQSGGQQGPVVGEPDLFGPEHIDVWVIDGRPRYHRQSCEFLQNQDSEPISLSQATEDGFIPCSLCEPNALWERTG